MLPQPARGRHVARGSHRAPVWNQEFQFLVEDPTTQVAELFLDVCCGGCMVRLAIRPGFMPACT